MTDTCSECGRPVDEWGIALEGRGVPTCEDCGQPADMTIIWHNGDDGDVLCSGCLVERVMGIVQQVAVANVQPVEPEQPAPKRGRRLRAVDVAPVEIAQDGGVPA